MDNLFENKDLNSKAPLADRMRPKDFTQIVGQKHLFGQDGPLKKCFASGNFHSMILWGPPGTGKTTIATMIANSSDYEFIRISAIESGVKELRTVIERAKYGNILKKKTLLFIDEIHRFNKSQQDSLLHAVETGLLILIGATTENPSFEVNAALISRCHVYRLHSLGNDDIRQLLHRAINEDYKLIERKIILEAEDMLISISGGDARTALNSLELATWSARFDGTNFIIDRAVIEKSLQRRTAQYDKKGDSHYDNISAFIKSLRGSDPSAAILWLAKMLDAGEDPKFIARRLIIFASEDIGNAEPYAMSLAVATFQATTMIGMPECRINLAQCVAYLASCPKSNASYLAIKKAESIVNSGVSLTVPLHLRNSPTKLMKEEGYGVDYKYPHDFPNHFVKENYYPDGIDTIKIYNPTNNGREANIRERLEKLWRTKNEND